MVRHETTVEGRWDRPGTAARDEDGAWCLVVLVGPVQHGRDVDVSSVMNRDFTRFTLLCCLNFIGRLRVADVDVCGAIGNEDHTVIGNGVFRIVEVEDAIAVRRTIGFIDEGIVGRRRLQVTVFTEPARTASL